MPYIEKRCEAGQTVEITRYYSPRYHRKGEKRQPKEEESCEAQKRVNRRKQEATLRGLMNNNFKDGDLLLRLDFHDKPGGSEEMQELMQKFLRRLRREYSKAGDDLKYIYVKEVGPKGGRHIHMLINKCDTDILRKTWVYGGIHIDPLNSGGQYRKIAEYFLKYADRTETTEERLIGKRWYGSRNLIKPKVTKKIISASRFSKNIRVPKGYYLEKGSEYLGVSENTGYEFMTFTLIKSDRQERGR